MTTTISVGDTVRIEEGALFSPTSTGTVTAISTSGLRYTVESTDGRVMVTDFYRLTRI